MGRRRTHNLPQLRAACALFALMALAFCPTRGHAQIPNAVADYQGTCWYYYTGSPWSFPVDIDITSQVNDRHGNWASLGGTLTTVYSSYYISGTIWWTGWVDLYATNWWGQGLHFYGPLDDLFGNGEAVNVSGSWEEYVPGRGYVPSGAFSAWHDDFIWWW